MIDLDPLDALALTLHHSPGVQALLLGSGISRAAGIPTGWEITVDLAARVGAVEGAMGVSDWPTWYQERFGRPPHYSEVLDAVASSPAERRSIIHAYIEGQGEPRQPTRAHRAIARLVSSGAVRVILTTNFDRLLEAALREAGVEPTVIASDDAILGATPLPHSRCTVLKLHGDYMDARIRNTEGELDTYSAPMDALLDRILDEYGLVVSGWSGEWDTALRKAILRAPNRRYPFYWTSQGVPAPAALDLVDHRDGRRIVVSDADALFERLTGKVEALRALDRLHPRSVAMTVAEGKTICRDERSAPEWADLLARELETTMDRVVSAIPTDRPTTDLVNEVVARIIGHSEGLRRLVLVGTRWGGEEAFRAVLRAIVDAGSPADAQSGYTYWSSLRVLPASMCFHWAIAGALMREDHERLARITRLELPRRYDGSASAAVTLPLGALRDVEWKFLPGLERQYTPHSWFFSKLFEQDARDVAASTTQAQEAWDDGEFWIALEAASRRLPEYKKNRGWFWVPPGRFVWRGEGRRLADRLSAIRALPVDAPQYRAGLLGGDAAAASEMLEAVEDFFRRVASSWH
ncbi:SIR2 family protein [Sphingomonas sp. CLY1604]|uniref:SIR2 family protein n=1 Tax=Sphingomonas sp. CLY1604 TaxID=3457786 RepID=UPI003FD854CC